MQPKMVKLTVSANSGDLSNISEANFFHLFENYGKVENVINNSSFWTILMPDESEAESAVEYLNGSFQFNCQLVVKIGNPGGNNVDIGARYKNLSVSGPLTVPQHIPGIFSQGYPGSVGKSDVLSFPTPSTFAQTPSYETSRPRMKATPYRSKLSIFGCSPKVTEEDIKNYFSRYSEIHEVYKFTEKEGMFFIHVEDSKTEEIILNCDNKEWMGCKISIDYSRPKNFRRKNEPGSDITKLVIFNIDERVTEDLLRKRFDTFCELHDLAIVNDKRGSKTGFVHVLTDCVREIQEYFRTAPFMGKLMNLRISDKNKGRALPGSGEDSSVGQGSNMSNSGLSNVFDNLTGTGPSSLGHHSGAPIAAKPFQAHLPTAALSHSHLTHNHLPTHPAHLPAQHSFTCASEIPYHQAVYLTNPPCQTKLLLQQPAALYSNVLSSQAPYYSIPVGQTNLAASAQTLDHAHSHAHLGLGVGAIPHAHTHQNACPTRPMVYAPAPPTTNSATQCSSSTLLAHDTAGLFATNNNTRQDPASAFFTDTNFLQPTSSVSQTSGLDQFTNFTNLQAAPATNINWTCELDTQNQALLNEANNSTFCNSMWQSNVGHANGTNVHTNGTNISANGIPTTQSNTSCTSLTVNHASSMPTNDFGNIGQPTQLQVQNSNNFMTNASASADGNERSLASSSQCSMTDHLSRPRANHQQFNPIDSIPENGNCFNDLAQSLGVQPSHHQNVQNLGQNGFTAPLPVGPITNSISNLHIKDLTPGPIACPEVNWPVNKYNAGLGQPVKDIEIDNNIDHLITCPKDEKTLSEILKRREEIESLHSFELFLIKNNPDDVENDVNGFLSLLELAQEGNFDVGFLRTIRERAVIKLKLQKAVAADMRPFEQGSDGDNLRLAKW